MDSPAGDHDPGAPQEPALDRAALEELLARHLGALEAYVRRRSGRLLAGRDHPSDLVQSTVREVLQNLSRFQHGGESGFVRWLFRTADRKVVDRGRYWRAQRRDAARDAAVAPDEAGLPAGGVDAASPSRIASGREELERVDRALQELPEDYRSVILLSRFLDRPYAEIAPLLDRSEGACRILLHRALARLALLLEEPESPGEAE